MRKLILTLATVVSFNCFAVDISKFENKPFNKINFTELKLAISSLEKKVETEELNKSNLSQEEWNKLLDREFMSESERLRRGLERTNKAKLQVLRSIKGNMEIEYSYIKDLVQLQNSGYELELPTGTTQSVREALRKNKEANAQIFASN